MRNIHKCPIYWKLLKQAIPCSFPEQRHCKRIGGSFLCQARVDEIGLKTCLKEVSELKDFAKHLNK